MKPSDPIAVSKRFAAVVARGLERADKELARYSALFPETSAVDEEEEEESTTQGAQTHPWDTTIERRQTRRLTPRQARRIIERIQKITAP